MTDPSPRPGRTGAGERVRHFVALYGWRAYAVPLLVLATLLTVLDLAGTTSPDSSAAGSSGSVTPSTPASAVTSAASSSAGPTSAVASSAPPAGESEPAATPTGTDPEPVTVVQRGAGTLSVVPGESRVLGTGGPVLRFRVEVEDGIGVDGPAFADAVLTTLGDPLSWGADGRLSFRRVSDGNYDFRVLLVSPDNVNGFCPGLDTGGYTSCRSGDHAVINLARWLTGVPDYAGDLPTYRQYVVNHEVGHYLGNGHELCGGPGELAPVMQQQTLGLEGCLKNPWPYPGG